MHEVTSHLRTMVWINCEASSEVIKSFTYFFKDAYLAETCTRMYSSNWSCMWATVYRTDTQVCI